MPQTRSLYKTARHLAERAGLEMTMSGSSTYQIQSADAARASTGDRMFAENFIFTGNIRTNNQPCHINVPERVRYPGIQDWFVYRSSKMPQVADQAQQISPLDVQGVTKDSPLLYHAGGAACDSAIIYASSIAGAVESEAIYLWIQKQAKSLVITHGIINSPANFTIYLRQNVHGMSTFHPIPLPTLNLADVASGKFSSLKSNGFEIVSAGLEKPQMVSLEEHLGLPRLIL